MKMYLGNSVFSYNRTKIWGTLHYDLSRFYCCRRHKFVIKHSVFFILLTVTCSTTVHAEWFVAFLFQQWLRERATMLRYKYIAYLVISLHSLK
jgi:hypothetical protein